MEFIDTKDAPQAIGPYSQGVYAGEFLFISGQIPINPETKELVSENIAEQTLQTLKNILAIVRKAGGDKSSLVTCNVFLKDIKMFSEFNRIYADFFGCHRPARVTVQVNSLPKDSLIEISAVAYIPRKER